MIEVSHAVVTSAGQLERQMTQVRETLADHADVPQQVHERLDDIETKLQAINQEMLGTDTDAGATQPGAPPLSSQIRQLYAAIGASTALPTREQSELTERSYELLGAQVEAVNRVIEADVPRLQQELDQAGVRWTPGRLIVPPRR